MGLVVTTVTKRTVDICADIDNEKKKIITGIGYMSILLLVVILWVKSNL